MSADRRREVAREQMRTRWADPEWAARMRANLAKGRGRRVRGDPPLPPPSPADPLPPPPPATPPVVAGRLGRILTSSPADLVDRLRRR